MCVVGSNVLSHDWLSRACLGKIFTRCRFQSWYIYSISLIQFNLFFQYLTSLTCLTRNVLIVASSLHVRVLLTLPLRQVLGLPRLPVRRPHAQQAPREAPAGGAKTPSLEQGLSWKWSIYQDRLGTNIGKALRCQKEKAIAAGLGRDGSSHLGRRRQREGRLSARLLLARLQLIAPSPRALV